MLRSAPSNPTPLEVDLENEVRALLIEHFAPIYSARVEDYVGPLLDPQHHVEQLNYLQSIIGAEFFSPASSLLISGFSAGSEMIAARQLGFGDIYGVEVDPFLQEICQKRLSPFTAIQPLLYDGHILPFEDGKFSVVTSSHIIEHTLDPALYLSECMRVMKAGGYLFLEFPHRYHRIELHTGLPSFEWLPRLIRDACLRVLRSRYSPLRPDVKKRYNDILTTHLQQISLGGVKRMLRKAGYDSVVVDHKEVLPGILRCVIRKAAG
jgi:ubiquinone/menaquinone biosynthesis C-methylase UbiE